LAKPLSKRIKHDFSRTQTGTYILTQIGQMSHQVTSRMTIWSAGYKVRTISPLPDEKAIQIGSEFVGESFILIVSSGVVVYEYNRSKVKEQEKYEQERLQAERERQELQTQLHAIYIRLSSVEDSLRQLQEPPSDPEADDEPPTPAIATPRPIFSWWNFWRRSPD
jgi:optic atrophy 3 protein